MFHKETLPEGGLEAAAPPFSSSLCLARRSKSIN
jgi:hypothetical protein